MNGARIERTVGTILAVAVTASVVLLALGVAGMALSGVGALDRAFPPFDPRRLAADLGSGRPDGFLWLGLVAAILTPAVRVVAALAGFARTGERRMTAVAVTVLAVICLSAAVGAGG